MPHEGVELRVKVRCYSGFKAAERPLGFVLRGRELPVVEVERSWREEDASGRARWARFRVRAGDGGLYLLSRGEDTGEWTLRRLREPEGAS